MKLFLIRHGQSTANLDKVYAGQTDVPLTEQGRREAEQIRPILAGISFDRVYSSDLSRAIGTQRIALPEVDGIRTPLLREYDVGALTGISFAQARTEFGNGFRITRKYSTFGGEDTPMVCKRVRKFLDILEADPCKNVAAFAHNGIMNCMLQVVLNSDFDHTAVGSKNCAIHVYEYDGSKWRLLAWNYMGTL